MPTGTPVSGVDVAAGDAGVGLVRLLKGQILGQGNVGLDLVLNLTNTVEHGLCQLTRGELLLVQEVAGLMYGEVIRFQNLLLNGKQGVGGKPTGSTLLFQDGPNSEQTVLRPGSVGQNIIGRKRVPGLVRAEDVFQRQGVGSGRHVIGVELAQDVEVVEDLG